MNGTVAEGPLVVELVRGRADVIEPVTLEQDRVLVEHMFVVGLALQCFVKLVVKGVAVEDG